MVDLLSVYPPELAGAPRIGTDEAGKGDYFGDLVVAGVYLDAAMELLAAEMGVRDSKKLTDVRARGLARELRAVFPHEIVRISPTKYNDLYEKMGNLNRLLAWAHARVIENLLPRTGASLVVADQFGNAAVLESALLRGGRRVRLVQIPKGERDLAVASASIVARAAFLKRLETLSHEAGLELPKGATHVLPTARALYEKGGLLLLRRVAKLHFRTTAQVVGEG
ncbi:MAG: Ribonuclease HIII [Chloroflexi bacterium ADurb.Bin222]|nr:MAG: Ribonuclease HIII [Chloroflexi bacterium ADurb.Bin222]